jgi:predicted DCC family thiol-disulfide oxidoreductase YuxK
MEPPKSIAASPAKSPAAPLGVVFDADCGVCQASVDWLQRRDPGGRFRFIGNDAPELPPGVSREETEHTVIVLDGQRKLLRAEAVARLLCEIKNYRLFGRLLRAPGLLKLANFGYDRFARNRHRISATLGLRACAVPRRS